MSEVAQARDCVADDAALIEQSLEIAAERCDDLTPLVYARFFELRPEARRYFELQELDPRSHGRMLAEVLCLLLDMARRESYVGPTLRTTIADHESYGIRDRSFYANFLDALQDVLAGLIAPAWSPAIAAAWDRQRNALLAASQ